VVYKCWWLGESTARVSMSSSGDGGVSKEAVNAIVLHNCYENTGNSMKGMMYAYNQLNLGDKFNVSLFEKAVRINHFSSPLFFLNRMSEKLLVEHNFDLDKGVYIGNGVFKHFETRLPSKVSDAHYFYDGNFWNVFSTKTVGDLYDHFFNPFNGMRFSSRVLNWTKEVTNEDEGKVMRHCNFFWIDRTTVLYVFDNDHFNIFDMENWRNHHVFPSLLSGEYEDGAFVPGKGDVDGSGLNQFSITRCSYIRPFNMPFRNHHTVLEFAMGGRFFVSIRGYAGVPYMSVCIFCVDTYKWIFSEPFVAPGNLTPRKLFVFIEDNNERFQMFTPRDPDSVSQQGTAFFAYARIDETSKDHFDVIVRMS
jgi:hypothetical protein